MNRYDYNGSIYTVKELSEMSGIAPATIRDRLRRGYSVAEAIKVIATNDSVLEFTESSWWEDWIGMSINDLYTIYWKWCISNGYTAIQKQGFSRQLLSMYPNLKIVPTRVKDMYFRYIRER